MKIFGRTAKVARLMFIASVAAVILLGSAWWRASRVLESATDEVRAERGVRFVVRPLRPQSEQIFEVISASTALLESVQFQGRLYVASSNGLIEYDRGQPVKQYVVGQELPGSPLVAMVPAILGDSHEPELLIATGDDGVLAFNGREFRQIYPLSADARAITCLLPVASGHLLIGTKKRGLLLYDGKQIQGLHATLSSGYVTSLAGSESDLWVGTLKRGVLHWHAGVSESFGEEQGLPDPQVLSIAVAEDTTYVGTPTGVAFFDRGRFARVLAPGIFATALLPVPGKLFVGTEDQGVITVILEGRHSNATFGSDTVLSEVHQLFRSGQDIFALTHNGLFRMATHGSGWRQILQPSAATLSDRNISALAADDKGRLWVGYFDRGLDVLEPDFRRVTHVENDRVFCVNRIYSDGKTGTVNVATANGLIRFDEAGNQEQVLTRADGLIADHVTDIVRYGDGMALATPAGLTFLDASGAQSMYAFHGLVNNHVYALGVSGDELMAGTLGGLSILKKENVEINYTTATSGLKHNWITAVVRAGDEWMIGTYGAGVFALDSSGRFHAFEDAGGQLEVNPNAMLVTPTHVFAGTLGKGLYVYERKTGRWFAVANGLPSSNVTALTTYNGYVYAGTDNGLRRVREARLHP